VSIKVVVIEDEPSIADTIVYALKSENMESVWFSNGNDGLQYLLQNTFDCVLIDIGLPDISGFEICKKIRGNSSKPVIFLTARSEEIDKVVGLEIGADDYITKPFSPRELTARVKAILRRCGNSEEMVKSVTLINNASKKDQVFYIDDEVMQIFYFGQVVVLSKSEFKILEAMIKHPRRVFSREELSSFTSDEPGFSMERTIDAHIKSIRNKLKTIKGSIDPIETRRGFGYALKDMV
jgi:two-component system catabolic regulation response regulator CreB